MIVLKALPEVAVASIAVAVADLAAEMYIEAEMIAEGAVEVEAEIDSVAAEEAAVHLGNATDDLVLEAVTEIVDTIMTVVDRVQDLEIEDGADHRRDTENGLDLAHALDRADALDLDQEAPKEPRQRKRDLLVLLPSRNSRASLQPSQVLLQLPNHSAPT